MKAARVLVFLMCVFVLTPGEINAQQSRRQANRVANSTSTQMSARFYPEKLDEIDAVIEQNISSNKLPGGVLWLEREGVSYHKAYGNRAVVPQREKMLEDTIFDAASLTKVIATAPSIMMLAERGKIGLDEPVARYIPEFATNNKAAITVRHLLTHTSGLRPGIPRNPDWSGYDRAIALASLETPTHPPGTSFRYSDINYILLGHIVSVVSKKSLDEFTTENIFRPLKMTDTGYRPAKSRMERIAPTERSGNEVLRGTVHDPTARRMGGVAGHAGLFTTAADLARFTRCILNEGELDGARILKPETARAMRTVQTPEEMQVRRGLGWDIDSPYAGPRGDHLPVGSFGHTGWTGTSLWIDPFSKTFVIFMSNRNHPDESGSVLQLRNRIGTLTAEAVRDFNFVYVAGALDRRAQETRVEEIPSAQVLNGIDVLKRNRFAQLRGLKIGLITNHTGADRERNPTIDLLHGAEGVQLVALFSPEHGIRGLVDEKVSDSKDEKTGLPIYSLYGERRTPTTNQLAEIDALVFDIQDIGCRFYTYISTMGNCMEAAAKSGKKFFVLDRVNPINGTKVEGPVLDGEKSFTGWHEIPLRHGMTVGELAKMFNEERGVKADLTVVPVQRWKREFLYDQTNLPWIHPSPNMRSLTQAILYPGVGLIEFCAVSVGRGTDSPFEVVGAPYMDDLNLAAELNSAQLPGVRFVPVRFTPNTREFKGELCKGVNIILTDREKCNVVDIGIVLATKLHQLYPKEFGLDKLNKLLVHKASLEAIREGKSLASIKGLWTADLTAFQTRREKFLLYK
jgi:uncharacterized protein YbbC (DUF1343 family)/CubicO group peptidase (beta-lactamase class C family)